MLKCLLTNKELPNRPHYLAGFQCSEKNKEYCPNYMHRRINGTNCRLLQNNERRYAKCCLRSTIEPIKEKFKNLGTVELAALFKELEEAYFDTVDADRRANLRAQLGAIEEILLERKSGAK